MKKYRNLVSQLHRIIIPLNIIYVIGIFLGIINYTGDTLGLVMMCISLSVSMIVFDLMFIILNSQFHITFFSDTKITQKFYNKKKEISFDNVKYIYFIDQLLILSNKKVDIPTSEEKISINCKKKIKKIFREDVIIWLNVADSELSQLININCSNAEKIYIGKINKCIIDMF